MELSEGGGWEENFAIKIKKVSTSFAGFANGTKGGVATRARAPAAQHLRRPGSRCSLRAVSFIHIRDEHTYTKRLSLTSLSFYMCSHSERASPSSSLAFFALALLGIFVMEAGTPSLARCLCFLNKPKFIEKRAPTTLFSLGVCVCVLEKCAPPALLRGLQRKMETLKFDLQERVGWAGEAAAEPGHQLKMAITSQEFIAWMRYHTHLSSHT